MAGGRGRAQSAWDEMVFRSMVRDGSRFYTPLGLVSEGTKVDFQLEANSYVYGGRFMTFLAYRYSPEKLVEWLGRKEGSKAYYASQFRQVFGKPIPDAWQEWVDFEKDFQEKNLAAIRTYPTTPYKDLSSQALGSVSRAFYDPDTRKLYAAFNHPGVVAHVGAISVDDGKVERIAEVKGPLGFFVTSLAWDPGSKTLFYTTDNADHRDVRSLDPRTGASKILLEGGPDRRARLQPGRHVALGREDPERHRDARADPRALHRVEAGPLVALRRVALRHGPLSPTGRSSRSRCRRSPASTPSR